MSCVCPVLASYLLILTICLGHEEPSRLTLRVWRSRVLCSYQICIPCLTVLGKHAAFPSGDVDELKLDDPAHDSRDL
jgi:hypothetical protein